MLVTKHYSIIIVIAVVLVVSILQVQAAFNPPAQAPPGGNVDAPVYSVGTSQTLTGDLAVTASAGTALTGSSIGYGLQGTLTTDSGSGDAAIYGNAFSADADDYAAVFYGGLGVQMTSGDILYINQDSGIAWPRESDGASLYGISVTTSGELRLHGHGAGIILRDQNENTRLTVSEAGVVNVASGGSLQVNSVDVCLSDGTNCQAASTPNLQSVTNAGNTTTQPITVATVNTGQGAYELYAMDQNVRTSDSPTFSTLTLSAGTSVNEFSTDTSLAGSSDDAVPTENAIKTYVDAAVAAAGGTAIAGATCSATASGGGTITALCITTCPANYEIVSLNTWCYDATGMTLGVGGDPGSWGCSTLQGGIGHNSTKEGLHYFRQKNAPGTITVSGYSFCMETGDSSSSS